MCSDDSGAFNTCGQEGTAFTNRGNVIRNNTFRGVRMHPTNDDGSGVLVRGNPIVSAIYFDAAMSGWVVDGNHFEDVMLGVFINGGNDHNVTNNHFSKVDHLLYMGGDSCYNPGQLAYENLKTVSAYPAWQKQYAGKPWIASPGDGNLTKWLPTTCHSLRNIIANNTYCNVSNTQNVTWASPGPQTALCLNCVCGTPGQCYGTWANNREQCPPAPATIAA